MRVKLIKSFKDAFGDAYNVYTKVRMDIDGANPWEPVLDHFKVLKMHKKHGFSFEWCVMTRTIPADNYMKEKFGSDEHRHFQSATELRKFLLSILPDWMPKGLYKGEFRELELID